MSEPNALRLAKWLDAMPSSGYALTNQAATELRRLHEEVNEQARLLGMSAERELALLAKIDRLERQLGEAVWNYGEKVRANQELLEALKPVLEALDVLMTEPIAHKAADNAEYLLLEAAPAIRGALAEQPAQQDMPKIGCVNHDCDKCNARQQEPDTPKFVRNVDGVPCITLTEHEHIVKQITSPAVQQEPVAWMYQCSADSSGPVLTQHKKDWAESGSGLWTETPLYTSPPAQRKQWVGLTEQERNDLEDYCEMIIGKPAFDAIEAKLKERNT